MDKDLKDKISEMIRKLTDKYGIELLSNPDSLSTKMADFKTKVDEEWREKIINFVSSDAIYTTTENFLESFFGEFEPCNNLECCVRRLYSRYGNNVFTDSKVMETRLADFKKVPIKDRKKLIAICSSENHFNSPEEVMDAIRNIDKPVPPEIKPTPEPLPPEPIGPEIKPAPRPKGPKEITVPVKPIKPIVGGSTIKYTRFEKARIIGARALQISYGAPVLVDYPQDMLDPIDIALLEYDKDMIPITVTRE